MFLVAKPFDHLAVQWSASSCAKRRSCLVWLGEDEFHKRRWFLQVVLGSDSQDERKIFALNLGKLEAVCFLLDGNGHIPDRDWRLFEPAGLPNTHNPLVEERTAR